MSLHDTKRQISAFAMTETSAEQHESAIISLVSVDFSFVLEGNEVSPHHYADPTPLSAVNLVLTCWVIAIFRYFQHETFNLVGSVQLSPTVKALELDSSFILAPHDTVGAILESTLSQLKKQAHETHRASAESFGFEWRARDTDRNSFESQSQLTCTLGLSCEIDGSTIHARLSFSPKHHHVAAIRSLSQVLTTLAARLAHAQQLPVETLPLLDQQQAEALKTALTGPIESVAQVPLHERIDQHGAIHPHHVAIEYAGTTLSYEALIERSNRLAQVLITRGVRAAEHVAVCLPPGPEFVISMLAIWKVGAVHVPIDPGYPSERLSIICADVRPALVITDEQLKALFIGLKQTVFSAESSADELQAAQALAPELHIHSDDIAYIVYTSGTTGRPKGVRVSHGNLAHYLAEACRSYGYSSLDVIPALARNTFSITFFELLAPLVSGARLVLLPPDMVLDMARMSELLTQVTCIHASPSLWRRILAHLDNLDTTPPYENLRHVSSGGDAVPPDVLESLKHRFKHAEVYVIYGCSEVSCMGCTFQVSRAEVTERTFVGKPFANMNLRVLDKNLNLVPPGVVGDVYFSGAGVAAGYLNAPALTDEKFTSWQGERIYKTGDVGRIDPEHGNLQLVGRSDFQIKLRGIRIEPAEIESHLRRAPAIKDAVVSAPVMPDGERQLIAYVVIDKAQQPTTRQLTQYLRQFLPDYMIPGAYVVLDALPLNINQKVDRLALSRVPDGPLSLLGDATPPRTMLEKQLVELWQDVLGVSGLGIHNDFFDIGGDSLRSLVLMGEIDKRLGVALPASTLLTAPTIALLAAHIEQGDDVGTLSTNVVLLRQGNGKGPGVFLVHDGDGETLLYRNLAQKLAPQHSVFGLHPKHNRNHPILLTRIDDIVRYYAEQIVSVQPQGPYFVGGLCIGGFLAFEVARYLEAQGHVVGPVALFDVAHANLPHKPLSAVRAKRLRAAATEFEKHSLPKRLLALARLLGRKGANVVQYEISSRSQRQMVRGRIQALRWYTDRGWTPPALLHNISVDSVLRFAEREYVAPQPFKGTILLFRATRKDPALRGIVDDTPYMDLFIDPMLGWENRANTLSVHDVPAGHSSLLQAAHVEFITQVLQRAIDQFMEDRSTKQVNHS